jgi:hypothetical protein
MAISRGPKIVKDGLVLCVDAADKKSYPGSGNKWFDLTENKTNLSITIPSSYQGPSLNSNNFGSLKFNPAIIPQDVSSYVYGELLNPQLVDAIQYSDSASTYVLDVDVIPYTYNDSGVKVYGPAANIYVSQNGYDDYCYWHLYIYPFSTQDGFLFIVNQDDFNGAAWFDIPGLTTNDVYIEGGNIYDGNINGVGSYNFTTAPAISPQYIFSDFAYYNNYSSKFNYGTGDFSWEVWVNPISFKGDNNYIIDHGVGGNSGTLQYYQGILRYYNPTTGSGSALFTVGGGSLSLNTWYHIVVSRISGVTSIYVNGVLKVSAADTYNYPDQYFYLCRYGGSDVVNWSGYISLCRIYKGKGLNAKEVLQNFNCMKGRYKIK